MKNTRVSNHSAASARAKEMMYDEGYRDGFAAALEAMTSDDAECAASRAFHSHSTNLESEPPMYAALKAAVEAVKVEAV